MKLKNICCCLEGSHWPILLPPFAMALCKLRQKPSGDLCSRNLSSPALLSQMQKTAEFCLIQSLLVSIKFFLNQRYACGRAFLFMKQERTYKMMHVDDMMFFPRALPLPFPWQVWSDDSWVLVAAGEEGVCLNKGVSSTYGDV